MKIKNYLYALFFIFSFLPLRIFAFSDIENSWYKDFISEAKQKEYIQGYGDETFRPEQNISREEFLKILFKVQNIEVQDSHEEDCFSDINDSLWSKKYICSAKNLGITKGYDDDTFRPYNTITHIEALAFIARSQGFHIRGHGFPIDDKQFPWFENYRIFFHTNNIFLGNRYTSDTLLPRSQATELLLRSQQSQVQENISSGCSFSQEITETQKLEVSGNMRNYILDLPENYTQEKSYPLIFAMHGRTNSNAMVRDYMGLEKYPGGAIVVYPAGLGDGPYTWHQQENIEYFDQLLVYISQTYCIQRDKVFVVGHSLGGYFTYKLGCLRGDVIRAISVVGGSMYAGNCPYPVATQIFHRPDDHLVSYREGDAMRGQFQKLNLCMLDEENTQDKNYGSISHKHDTCSFGNPVVFADDFSTYLDDPHSWPKKGNQTIFEFFESLE